MALGQGATSKAAFKIENSAWGTSTDCGAGDQIHIISESISHAIEQAQAVHKDGNVGAKSLYPIAKKYSGDLLVEAHYAGLESLIACAFGMSHQNYSPVNTSTDAYEHYFEPSSDMSSRLFNAYEMTTPSGTIYRKGTLCLEKDVSVWELGSAMINAMNIEAGPERVTFSFTVAGQRIQFDTATNSASTSWSLPGNTEQITWDDLTFRIKARDSFTITSANDNFIIDEGGGDVTLDIADGTYTGYGLAQAIAVAANASGSLSGQYEMEYDENRRRFSIYTTNAQTFSVSGATMDMGSTVGITVDTTTAVRSESDFNAVPDAYAAFDSGDQVGINKFTMALENALDIESQDSESSLFIIEPERNGFRRVTGTIEIPRYKNDTFMDACNGFTTYMAHIKFTGSAIDSETYELNIYLPSIKFTNIDAPITGPELIKQTLAFEAEVPDILDLINFNFGSYFARSMATAGDSVWDMDAYIDGYLYVAMDAGIIKYWDYSDGSYTTSTDVGSNNIYGIKAYNGYLYAFDTGGAIYEFDGSSWSIDTDVGVQEIWASAVYADKLYVTERDVGKVFVKDGTSDWALSTDTASTYSVDLVVYKGNLYKAGTDKSTFAIIYKFDGTTWTTDTDFTGNPGQMSLAVHNDKLYASSGSDLYVYDGSSWSSIGAMGISIRGMISHKNNLLFLQTGSGGDLYYFNEKGSTAVSIYAWNFTDGVRFRKYQNKLFIADATNGAGSLKYLDTIQEMLITIQNQNSTNPL